LTVNTPGKYTFVVYTDDGYALDIRDSSNKLVDLFRSDNSDVANQDGIGGNDTLFHDTNCCTDRLGVWDLAAGNYTLESAFEENGGGAGFYIYGAQGDVPRTQADGSFNPQFVLVGDDTTGRSISLLRPPKPAVTRDCNSSQLPNPARLASLGWPVLLLWLAGVAMPEAD
jgi:hypothetical protein